MAEQKWQNKNGGTKMGEQKLFIILSHPNKNWWGQCKCKKVSGTEIGLQNKKNVSGTKIGEWKKKKVSGTKIDEWNKTAEQKLVSGTKKRSAEQKLVSTVSGTKIIYQVMW